MENTRTTRTNPDSESPLALILARSGLPESTGSPSALDVSRIESPQLEPSKTERQSAAPRQPDPARGIVYVAVNERWKTERQSPTLPIPANAYAWAQEGDSEWTYLK